VRGGCIGRSPPCTQALGAAMLSFFLLGAGIGFVFGVSPGPVLTLVLAETMRGGWLRGAAVALGPLLADGPIIALAFFVLTNLPTEIIQALSLVGGAFLLYLAATTLWNSRQARLVDGERLAASGGLLKGFLARALTPHAYLFWFLVGSPLVLQGSEEHWLAAPAFLAGYYSTIVGSNVALALALDRWVGALSGRLYQRLLLLASAVLGLYGLTLLGRGVVAQRPHTL
jgi:threonine/homoserine/homoserine lactone efflux protein